MTTAHNTALALLREIYDDVKQGAIPNHDEPWWDAASAALAAPAQAVPVPAAPEDDECQECVGTGRTDTGEGALGHEVYADCRNCEGSGQAPAQAAAVPAPGVPSDLRDHLRWALRLLRSSDATNAERYREAFEALARADAVAAFPQTDATVAATEPAAPAQAGEPWYGHKFKESQSGIWRCECGKTVKETTADWLDMSADEMRNLRTETAALCADYDADRAARGAAQAAPVDAAVQQDAERYRWLTFDHADAATRMRVRAVLDRLPVMSYSAACEAIDAARAAQKGGAA